LDFEMSFLWTGPLNWDAEDGYLFKNLNRSPALNDSDQNHGDGNEQKQVNKAAEGR
jgi:hypothetical protein